MGKKKFTAVGCYIFAGGFTLGVQKHFDVLCHLEDGTFGVETANLNFPLMEIYTDRHEWPLKELRDHVDFIYCNPPCAPWSATGASTRKGTQQWRTDPRVACVHHAFNVFRKVRPRVWVWESVTMAYTRGKDLVQELTKKAKRMGYSVTYLLTDAQLHGLPQRRQRFHLVIHDIEINFTKPPCEIVTVGQALRRVKSKNFMNIKRDTLRLIKKTKPGEGLRKTFDRLNKNPKYNARGEIKGRPVWMNFRLRPHKPSSTLIGACHAIHPFEDRWITPEEHATLCGYPQTFAFAGDPRTWYKQAAQAVTEPIGDYLGQVVRRALLKDVPTSRVVQEVDFRPLVKQLENAR